jgi:hypothetical protein
MSGPIRLTREQHRKMEALGVKTDRITQADAKFFQRFLDRKHRVRLTSRAEIEQREIVEGKSFSPPPFCRAYIAVKQIVQGIRLRLFVYGLENADTDMDEATARAIYESAAGPRTREIENAMREAAEARPK